MCWIFTIGIVHEKVFKNPIEKVETPSTSNYKAIMITPAQTMAILGKFGHNLLQFTLLHACAATALRASAEMQAAQGAFLEEMGMKTIQ